MVRGLLLWTAQLSDRKPPLLLKGPCGPLRCLMYGASDPLA